jgi:hypothetical protein
LYIPISNLFQSFNRLTGHSSRLTTTVELQILTLWGCRDRRKRKHPFSARIKASLLLVSTLWNMLSHSTKVSVTINIKPNVHNHIEPKQSLNLYKTEDFRNYNKTPTQATQQIKDTIASSSLSSLLS